MHISDEELSKWIEKEITPDTELGKAIEYIINKDKNINTIVDTKRMEQYINSVKNIKNYCEDNCVGEYTIKPEVFETSKKNADYTLLFDELSFNTLNDMMSLIEGASWMCLGVSNDDRVSLTVEFWDCAKEVK